MFEIQERFNDGQEPWRRSLGPFSTIEDALLSLKTHLDSGAFNATRYKYRFVAEISVLDPSKGYVVSLEPQ